MSNEYVTCNRTAQRKLRGAVCALGALWRRFPRIRRGVPLRLHLLRNLCVVLCLSCGTAQADTLRITPDMVQTALVAQGYTVQSVTRTLLGRARIVAQMGGIWREVVLDLSSGQILRDYAVEFAPNDQPDRRSDVMPRGGTVLDDSVLAPLEN